MSPALIRLYVYHALNSVAMCFITSSLFIDQLVLRAGVNMTQFGVVMSVGTLAASAVNFVASPVIAAGRFDRGVTLWAMGARCLTAGLFLAIPLLVSSPSSRMLAFCAAMVVFMLFGYLANTSLASVCRMYVSPYEAGRHSAGLHIVWMLPGRIAAVACGWYIARYAQASDTEFRGAVLVAAAVTSAAHIPGIFVMMRLGTPPAHAPAYAGDSPEVETPPRARFTDLLAPYRDPVFRPFLRVQALQAGVLAMATTFVYAYLTIAQQQDRRWSSGQFALADSVMTIGGLVLLPVWGRLADRLGGRNVLHIATLGMAVSLVALAGGGAAPTVVFALLAWGGHTGLFGAGLTVGQRYIQLAHVNAARANVDLAALGLVGGVGYAIGATGGGILLDTFTRGLRGADSAAAYQLYFAIAAIALALVSLAVARLPDGRERLSPRSMLGELAKEIATTSGFRR